MTKKERERHRERHRDRQTEREREIERQRHRDRQTQTDRHRPSETTVTETETRTDRTETHRVRARRCWRCSRGWRQAEACREWSCTESRVSPSPPGPEPRPLEPRHPSARSFPPAAATLVPRKSGPRGLPSSRSSLEYFAGAGCSKILCPSGMVNAVVFVPGVLHWGAF